MSDLERCEPRAQVVWKQRGRARVRVKGAGVAPRPVQTEAVWIVDQRAEDLQAALCAALTREEATQAVLEAVLACLRPWAVGRRALSRHLAAAEKELLANAEGAQHRDEVRTAFRAVLGDLPTRLQPKFARR